MRKNNDTAQAAQAAEANGNHVHVAKKDAKGVVTSIQVNPSRKTIFVINDSRGITVFKYDGTWSPGHRKPVTKHLKKIASHKNNKRNQDHISGWIRKCKAHGSYAETSSYVRLFRVEEK